MTASEALEFIQSIKDAGGKIKIIKPIESKFRPGLIFEITPPLGESEGWGQRKMKEFERGCVSR